MKKVIRLLMTIVLLASSLAFVTLINAVPLPLMITGGLDLTAYSQNAMRVYFNQNITNSDTDVTIANVQLLAPGDPNYDEAVVNGVLDGIFVDGTSVRDLVDAGGPYGGAIHFYKEGSSSYIAVYTGAELVNFSDGNAHTVTVTSKFQAYSHVPTVGGSLVFDPVAKTWSEAKLTTAGAIDLTAYSQNAMRIYFNENITNSDTDVTIANLQMMAPTDPNYDPDVVNGVLNGITVDGQTIAQLVEAGGSYGGAVHFYREGTSNFIAVYADAALVNFTDGETHTVALNSQFKSYSLFSAPATTYYLDPDSMTWSDTAPLPTMAVTGGDSEPTFAWGNTMRVLFDTPLWIPAHGESLLVGANQMATDNEYYNADAVASLNDKITVDGKTITQWNTEVPGGAQVHVGADENDIRIYLDTAQMNFADGNTHVVTIAKNFISFNGYKTAEEVSLHYDPVAKTWGTEVVVPPTPTPAAPTEFYTATPVMMNGNFGTAYFYTTSVITTGQVINVQAGGGSIPESVQNAVNDLIRVDGKTVREWNTENGSNYAVMVAYESEDVGGGNMVGRLSFWIDTTSTCNFVAETDHTIEFLDGLVGLNGALIAPSTWLYDASEMDWFLQSDEEPTTEPTSEPTSEPTTQPTESVSEDAGSGVSSEAGAPATSDSGAFLPVLMIALAAAGTLVALKLKPVRQ